MTEEARAKRVSNKRGLGINLREEIIEAAERLLAEFGPGDAVTLRAIAREAGIAAPSIYPHFADRDSILDAVVSRTFRNLAQACRDAGDAAPDGTSEVAAISVAYVRYAREFPGRYRILFERSTRNIASPPHAYTDGIQAFGVLVTALERASRETESDSSLIERDAQALFAALHGIASLRPALPGFPWQDETALIHHVVGRVLGPPTDGTDVHRHLG
ncbi:TetR family transcriptional regulator [Glaciihabitans tibetensis]|uniref:TetR family transcriptional regulator n=1 Tax=Glaciihabitans tibetensis TaxID=1266600 RepID=A0A2T0VA14_9MICO|nr:TetR/AcrR family transcriptional regulator [Glaciihabitans tibetensis]PRY66993.1 TetR family transcriptional regulator [Glaciihabitans tibetensis]